MRILILTLLVMFSVSSLADTTCDSRAERLSIRDMQARMTNLIRDLGIPKINKKKAISDERDILLCELEKSFYSGADDQTRTMAMEFNVMLFDIQTVDCSKVVNTIKTGYSNTTQEQQKKLPSIAQWGIDISQAYCHK